MTTYVIDTNALISFVTDRNIDQQNRIKEIFESAALLKCRVLCPQNVITEFVYVMEKGYGIEPSRIRTMISDFLEMTGVQVIHDLDYKMLFTFWPEPVSDFADAIIAATARAHKSALIATFDKKLITALKKLGMMQDRFLKHK